MNQAWIEAPGGELQLPSPATRISPLSLKGRAAGVRVKMIGKRYCFLPYQERFCGVNFFDEQGKSGCNKNVNNTA
jgi:hypothetical protein